MYTEPNAYCKRNFVDNQPTSSSSPKTNEQFHIRMDDHVALI